MDLEDASQEAARLAQEAGRLETMHREGAASRDGARFAMNRAVAAYAEDLILDLRPHLAAIVEKARPHAKVLARFAPSYSAGDMLHRATPKELKAYQASVEIERRFGALLALWRACFKTLKESPAYSRFDTRWVEQVHMFFANPEAAQDDALAGRKLNRSGYPVAIQPTALAVASEHPDVGFRLATVEELMALFKADNPGVQVRPRQPGRPGIRVI